MAVVLRRTNVSPLQIASVLHILPPSDLRTETFQFVPKLRPPRWQCVVMHGIYFTGLTFFLTPFFLPSCLLQMQMMHELKPP